MISYRDSFLLIQTFSSSYWLRITVCCIFFFPCLAEPMGKTRVIAFLKIFTCDSYSSVKLKSTKIATMSSLHVVRFHTPKLFSLSFPFKLFQVLVGNVLCCMLYSSCLDVPRGAKKVLAFSKTFTYDSCSSIKLTSSYIEKMFPLSMVRFYPGKACHHLCPVKTHHVRQLRQFHRTIICEVRNVNFCKSWPQLLYT